MVCIIDFPAAKKEDCKKEHENNPHTHLTSKPTYIQGARRIREACKFPFGTAKEGNSRLACQIRSDDQCGYGVGSTSNRAHTTTVFAQRQGWVPVKQLPWITV